LQNPFARLFPADTTNAEGMKRNTEPGELNYELHDTIEQDPESNRDHG
jgi:hypothetical protein